MSKMARPVLKHEVEITVREIFLNPPQNRFAAALQMVGQHEMPDHDIGMRIRMTQVPRDDLKIVLNS
jgi:hypothetical protein